MPDVQEVFRMATQKVRPEPGFIDRQHGVQRRHSRNRRLGAIGLIATIAIVGAVVVFRSLGDRSAPEPLKQPTGSRSTNLRPGMYVVDLETGDRTRIGETPASPVDASPDGSMIAFGREVSGSPQIFVASANGTNAQRVTDDPFEAADPDWSPDGKQLAYAGFGEGAARSVFILDLATGEARRITHGPPDASDPAWSPDGRRILYTVEVPTETPGASLPVIRSVDVATGEVTDLTDAADGAADGEWSPDGSTIAYASDVVGRALDDEHGIFLMNADGTGARQLADGPPTWTPVWSPDGSRIAYFVEVGGVCCNAYVVDVETGEAQLVQRGGLFATWLDDRTLVVEIPYG